MRRAAAAVVFGAAVASAVSAQAPAAAPAAIEIKIDTRAAREILATLARPKWEPTDARLLEDMPAVALAIRDSSRDNEVFERDLKAAYESETRVSVFDFRSVREARTRWEALVAAVNARAAELARMASARAAVLLPGDRRAPAKLDVLFSFGLAGLADHLVARGDDGGEIVVVDLARALGDSEGEPLDSRLGRLARLIAGQAFRQAWASYRADSPAWKKPEPELGSLEPLVRIVAEAGPVATFSVDDAFFPLSVWLKDLQKRSLQELDRAAERIVAAETELEKRVEIMSEMRRPDFARRVAAPAGMFLVDAIRQVSGPDALKAALAAGPLAVFAAYDRAAQKNKELPPLSKLIKGKLVAASKAQQKN